MAHLRAVGPRADGGWRARAIVNGLSDDFHPCQLLADLLTIREHKGDTKGRKLVFVGDGLSNMGHSYLLAGAVAGMHVAVVSPEGYLPRQNVVDDATKIAAETGGSIAVGTRSRNSRSTPTSW